MRLVVMQPYFFPYLGYFQLIKAAEKFVFYDDVNYITRGWVNRNQILINEQKKYFTLSLRGASQNKKINEIKIGPRSSKVLKSIRLAYASTPYFEAVFPLIKEVFDAIGEETLISNIAGLSVTKVANYLGLETSFEYSSEAYADTEPLGRAERLIEICKRNGADTYINAEGGIGLYRQETFQRHGISLKIIKNSLSRYEQFGNEFVPYLSIIDVLMFNSPQEIQKMLDEYELE